MVRVAKVPNGGGYNYKTGDVTDSSGRVVSTQAQRQKSWTAKDWRNIGGGSSGNAGSGQRRREAAAAALAQARAAAQAQAAAAELKRLAEEKAKVEAKIKAAKTFAEKQTLARAFIQNKAAQVEKRRILSQRTNLIVRGSKEYKVMSKDVKTGNKLEVTQWRDKYGNRVERIKNLNTGYTTYSSFARPTGGGNVRQTGGVTFGSMVKIPGVYKIDGSTDKRLVKLPNGQQVTINAVGRSVVGKNLAGERYVFYDGRLVQIGDDAKIKLPDGEVQPFKKLSIKEYLKAKIVIPSSVIKEKVTSNALDIKERYSRDVASASSSIETSASRGDISRLAALQRKKSLTVAERTEKDKLTKIVAANYKRAGEVIGKSVAISLIGLGFGSVALAVALKTDPINTIKLLPRSAWEGVKQDWGRARSSSLGAVTVAAEWIALGAVLRGAGSLGKGTLRQLSKLSPKYVKYLNGKFVIRKTPLQSFKVKGSTRYLKTRVLKPSFKRPFSSVADFLKGRKPGQFKKFTKDPGLILKQQTVKTGSTPLSGQAALAGQEVTAVNAAAQQLTSWLRRKKIIRKPIPGETGFPSKIKNILKKFDDGIKLSNKEFADVNKWLQKNVAPNITLLERSLYLDPASGLRISRLGIEKARSATLKDILRGNFKLWGKSGKPQVLIFENARIAKFPKALRVIERKLKAGKKLTTAETNKLIEWQVKSGSGKFKPIGSTIYEGGKELEITLAPGEYIKRIKKVGFTYIDGKKVTFVTAEIWKPTKIIINKIKKANLGKLSKTQLKQLEKSISKSLGRKIRIETPSLRKVVRKSMRRVDANIPVLRVRAGGLFVRPLRFYAGVVKGSITEKTLKGTSAKRTSAKRTSTKRTAVKRKTPKRTSAKRTSAKRKPSKRTPVKKTTAKRKTAKRTSAKRKAVSRRITGRKTPSKKKPPIIPIKLPKGFKKKTLSKKQNTYYVVEKVRGKFKKLYPKPLTAKDAKDYAVYSIDNRLSKTAFFIPLGKAKKVISPGKNIQGYYSKNSRKVRPYKIKYGKKKQMVNGFIEKRKYFQDTHGEKRQLRATIRKAKKIKRPIRQVKRQVKRTATRRTMPKRTIKRKVVRKVLKRTPRRRKLTTSQRKAMLRNLKKARATKGRK